MIRRTALAAAAAVAFILVPSSAMAADYFAPGISGTVSDATPAAGAPFTVTLSGAGANAAVTLSTPGMASITKNANAAGVVTFTLTFSTAGAHVVTLTNAAGDVLSTQTVTVGGTSVTGSTTGQLARTGFDGTGLAVGGGVLVIAGAGAVLVARRRKSTQAAD